VLIPGAPSPVREGSHIHQGNTLRRIGRAGNSAVRSPLVAGIGAKLQATAMEWSRVTDADESTMTRRLRTTVKQSLPLSRVYRLLEPGPVVVLTTMHGERANAMPMSWHTMLDFEPPLVGCVVSNRNFSFAALKKTRECVINIPTVQLAEEVVKCGNVSGRHTDKFAACGLTPLPASQVAAPLIAECYANLECRVVDAKLVTRYDFFVLEVLKAWVDPKVTAPRTIHHRGRGEFMVAGRTIKFRSRKK
jgi:flavin reductase (DIM6/NTAB) family NADH-FMN oxidoreductase RutF